MSYSRFAIYFVPPRGPLADFGATWLGWDVWSGVEAPQPDMAGLHDITMTPRKYGFHGTLKPPFGLAQGQSPDALQEAVAALAAATPSARCDGLGLTTLGRFLALTPRGDMADIQRVANACVQELDRFRAPASDTEQTRRRQAGLSANQEALLVQWGYPYVMDEFTFHLTLSNRLPDDKLSHWASKAEQALPALPAPFVLDAIALCGERQDGRFEVVQSYALTG